MTSQIKHNCSQAKKLIRKVIIHETLSSAMCVVAIFLLPFCGEIKLSN